MSERTKNIVITCLFSIVFLGFFGVNILKKDQDVSEQERRRLKQFPAMSMERILDTTFMEDFNKYTVDQFVFRDEFRSLKAYTELDLFRKKDYNDLFVHDGHVFKILYPLNEAGIKISTNKMNAIYDTYLAGKENVYYGIIPDKNYYLSDDLGYLKLDYDRFVSLVQSGVKDMHYIDLFDTLSLDSYFKTDIHWRQDKLFGTARRIGDAMQIPVAGFDSYRETKVPGFKGAYYGQIAKLIATDTLVYLSNEALDRTTVYRADTGTFGGIYDLDKLSGIDKYDVFLSGAVPFLEINNLDATTDRELIIFRDSFGSSLAPLLVESYQQVTLVDIRYISTDYLAELVEFKDQDVLFLYSVNILNNGAVLR